MYDLSSQLTMAKDRLIGGQAYSEIPDVVGYADVDHQWEYGYRAMLETAIRDGDYGPTHTEIVDYPKNAIDVRPLARFSARDRLIYDTLVFSLAPQIDKQLSRAVYSYRWNHRDNRLRFWLGSWTKMRRILLRALRRDSKIMLASVDVSSFYEHVDIGILADDLESVTADRAHVTRIQGFLTGFQNINHAWGLPQGSDASGILANLYLAPVDEFLRREGFPHLRYSDDVMIFGRDWSALRDALAGVNKLLRSRRLSTASHKTAIRDPEEALSHVYDIRKASIQYGYSAGHPGAIDEVRSFFDDVIKEDPPDGTDLKFAINRMRGLRDDYAISWCLDNLPYVAHAAREIFDYFGVMRNHRGRIAGTLITFMQSGRGASYPYLEQRIIRYFLRERWRDERLKEAAWGILYDRNREDFPREFASRYLGRYSSTSEAQLLRHLFEEEPSISMRRSMLLSLHESRNVSPRYLREVKSSLRGLRWVCNYLESEPLMPTF